MRRLVLGCALAALAAASPASAGVKEGVDAWLAGDYPKAVAEWKGPAAAGEPDAMFNLGQAYKLGRGVPADQNAAMEWYKKAAAAGHEQAQATLGLQLFQMGKRDEAMIWLKKAADQGEPRAQYVVGTAYFNGDSLPKDWARAYALMTRAKAAGIGAASTSLAQMDQLIPEQQRNAGIVMAREMERTSMLKANDTTDNGAPLTMRSSARAPEPVGQSTVPAPTPAQSAEAPAQPWKAPGSVAGSTKLAAAMPKPAATAPAPAPKPAPVITKPAAAAAPKPVAAPIPKPAATIVASAGGGWKIQLGAFSSPDGAHGAWTMVSGKASALKALTPTYTAAGKFTRLQAGPLGSRAAANEACAAVKAAGSACFPVAP
jgi:cell division septation protein DedD